MLSVKLEKIFNLVVFLNKRIFDNINSGRIGIFLRILKLYYRNQATTCGMPVDMSGMPVRDNQERLTVLIEKGLSLPAIFRAFSIILAKAPQHGTLILSTEMD